MDEPFTRAILLVPVHYQDLSRFSVPPKFRGRNKVLLQLWWFTQASLFKFSPQILYGFRRFLLRCFGAKIGRRVLIRPTAHITYPWHLQVGDYCWIGDDTVSYNLAPVVIGSHVAIAHRVYLCTGQHDISRVTFDIGAQPIVVEDEVWLANDCFIAPGIRIGKGTVIGARSTVLRDMPSGAVCAGYPCKVIRDRRMKIEGILDVGA
jgi:putative colanic acid biosynthesis acetyltransferase WcaF